MNKLKLVNVVAPWNDTVGWSLIMHCVSCGFEYKQTSEFMRNNGYCMPQDLFDLFNSLFDVTMDVEVGSRQGERS